MRIYTNLARGQSDNNKHGKASSVYNIITKFIKIKLELGKDHFFSPNPVNLFIILFEIIFEEDSGELD
jgi:hypothetical protein